MNDRRGSPEGFAWEVVAREAAKLAGTPTYLFSWELMLEALEELRALSGPLPIRHWLSMKTLPVRRLVAAWKGLGGVEVVSEFELLAALHEGYPPERILVNGVAKHHWLPRSGVRGLRVHFDSRAELEALATQAAEQEWRIGLRFHPENQRDSEESEFPDQFGLSRAELLDAAELLRGCYPKIEGLHFHLRSNVPRVEEYLIAARELATVARELDLKPAYVDCGGGFPVEGESTRAGVERSAEFRMAEVGKLIELVAASFPSAREVWFENGRFVSARAGALVVKVLDVKERGATRYLICDGGRTNHAIVSDWEIHRLSTVPARSGPRVFTTVCGPTCMSFDRLGRFQLPADLVAGDLVLWMNAGAYHAPWESRFSSGLSALVWLDENRRPTVARRREDFRHWWTHDTSAD